jgi:peptidoglycan/LPS O-acetylase OafA/YrhL
MTKENLSRIPELDGMRGLAILLVLMVHIIPYNPVQIHYPGEKYIASFASMGWAGVDIFFVLSGFLITSILLRTKSGAGYFKKFYVRRILRIFPLYYITITIVFIVAPLINSTLKTEVLANMPWYYLYIVNWGFAFNRLTDSLSIGLTWSLAIEEQFYLAWPLVVYYLNSKKLAFLSVILILSSLIIRVGLFNYNGNLFDYSEFFYHATFTRFDSLILGALIAVAFESEWWKGALKRIAVPILFITVGLVGYLIRLRPDSPLWDNPPMYTYGFTLLALGAGGLIVILTTSAYNNPLRRLFRNSILSFFGKYSYAIYIFHRLVIQLLEDGFKNNQLTGFPFWLLFNVLSVVIPVIMALISWNLFENPILNLKRYFEYQVESKKISPQSAENS